MITPPLGVSWGSTVTWYAVVPTNLRSRLVELMGSGLPLESTLFVLSSSFQVAPPSEEIRKPTPGASEAYWPLVLPPVAAMMID